MLTPAQRHLQRVQAMQAAQSAKPAKSAQLATGAVTSPHGAVTGSAYELLLAQLSEHLRSLKTVSSMENKAKLKAQFIEVYAGWVDGVLESGTGQQDEVFMTVLIWCIDAGLYQQALTMARYAIRYGLETPDQFVRTLPEVLMDEYSNAALSGKIAAGDAAGYLQQVIALTDGKDTKDEIKAKLYKAYAYALLGRLGVSAWDTKGLTAETAGTALQALKRALQLHTAAGVKKDIEKLERWAKKEAPQLLQTDVHPAPAAAHANSEGTGNAGTQPDVT